MTFSVPDLNRIQYNDGTNGWVTISEGSTGYVMTRHRDKAAVLQFSVFDTGGIGLDPSAHPGNDEHLRKGQKVRVQVRKDTGSSWTTELTATIRSVDVDPLKLKGTNRRINVKATNKVTDLIMHSHGVGAGKTDDVRYTLKDVADFNVNGNTSSKSTPDEETFDNDLGSMWEGLLVARDSQDFYLHVDKNDVVVVTDRASKTSSTVADITPSDYKDVALDYTIQDIINDVTVKVTKKNKNGKYTLRSEVHKTRSGSIAKYGHFKATYTMHNRANAADYAEEILDANADPDIVPTGCKIPIKSGYAIQHFIQGIDLNDKVTIEDPDGSVFSVRVVATKETVTPNKWIREFTFKNPVLKAKPRRTAGTGVANVTDGQVETDFMDDKAITTGKLADKAVTTGKINDAAVTEVQLADGAVTPAKTTITVNDIGGHKFTTSSSAPSSPVTGDYWVDSGNGYELKRYNGSTWDSIQDAAIGAAQADADLAQTTADGKNKIFVGSSTPTATATNDQWIDTGNGNVIKTWNGSSWVNRQDTAIAAAQADADTAQTTADGKNTVHRSTSDPSGTPADGDIWFKYSGSNVIGMWLGSGGSWVSQTLRNEVIATLDAAKITTGTLDADRIAAQTITADKLLIGGGLNRVANPGFENGSTAPFGYDNTEVTWALSTTQARGGTGTTCIELTSINNSGPGFFPGLYIDENLTTDVFLPVATGDVVRGEAWVKKGTSGFPQSRILFNTYDKDGHLVLSIDGTAVTLTTSYQLVAHEFTVASGIAFVSMSIGVGSTSGTWNIGDKCYIDDLWFGTKTPGNLVVDGTITATQIAAGTVTASNIAAGTITANEIASNAITTAKLDANAVTAAKIAAGTITSTELASNSVVAGKIAAGSIDGMTITGPTIQTDSTGNRLVMRDDGSEGTIEFYSGQSGETQGSINPNRDGTTGAHSIQFQTSRSASSPNNTPGTMSLVGSYSGVGPLLNLNGTGLLVHGGSGINGDSGISVSGGYSLTGGGTISGTIAGGPTFNAAPTFTNGFTSNGATTFNGTNNDFPNINTTTNTANANFNTGSTPANRLRLVTSLSKFKLDQRPISSEDARQLLALVPKTWFDKAEVEENDGSTEGLRRIPGFVAEDVEEHAPDFATYDGNGDLLGVSYDRIPAALLVLVQDQQKQIDALTARLEALESKSNGS